MTEMIKKQELLIETLKCLRVVLNDAIADAEQMREIMILLEDDGE